MFIPTTTEFQHSGPMPNRAPFLLGVEIAMVILAVVVMVLRTRLRRSAVGRLRLEDWCCIGATVVLVSMVIVHIISVHCGGIGKHIWDLDFQETDIIVNLKAAYVGRILYPFATGLTRQSVLLLLLRIFPIRKFRVVVIGMIVINLMASIASCLVVALQCMPISHTFIPSTVLSGERPGCLNSNRLALAIPAINVALDVIVALLPVRTVMKIALPGKNKALILGMLGLGGLASVACGMRLMCIKRSFGNPDTTWTAVEICLWAIAEVTIGIVCVSVPALRPIVKTMNMNLCSLHVLNRQNRKSITDLRASKSTTRTSFGLGSVKKPEKAMVQIRMQNNGSVEQFRPNHINRTVTEIEAVQGGGYQGVRDIESGFGGEMGGDDREDFTASNGIVRKMEVAVTISDRV